MKKVKKNRILMFVILCVWVIGMASCSNSKTDLSTNDAADLIVTTNIAASDTSHSETQSIIKVSSHFDGIYDLSDNKVMSEISDYIALIKVDSIEGVSNINRQSGEYISVPYTYGKATVIAEYKGQFEKKTIDFVRDGGTLPYDEWIKGDSDPEKMKRVREEAGLGNVSTKNLQVEYQMENDILLEEGKTYLMFLFQNPTFNSENEFIIHGYQYGLRELQQTNVSSYSVQNSSSLKVKNNMTGEWESLFDVVYLDETELS